MSCFDCVAMSYTIYIMSSNFVTYATCLLAPTTYKYSVLSCNIVVAAAFVMWSQLMWIYQPFICVIMYVAHKSCIPYLFFCLFTQQCYCVVFVVFMSPLYWSRLKKLQCNITCPIVATYRTSMQGHKLCVNSIKGRGGI
jgi:hypothetical protein